MSENYERQAAPESIPDKYISVRENRGKNWYWANNHLYDEIKNSEGETTTFAATLGSFAINVYHLLARLIDNESQTCWPSYPYIARRCGMSRTTTISAIKKLEMHQLISYKQRDLEDGKSDSNLYTLRPIGDWKIDAPGDTSKPVKKKKKAPSSPPDHEGARNTPPSAPDERGGTSDDHMGVRQMDGEGAPDGLYKDPPYQNPVQQDTQQQQAKPKQKPKSGKAAGAGVGDLADQKNGAEIETIVEKLHSFGTGLSRSVIRTLVVTNPEHGKIWAQYWPAAREAADSYWAGKDDRRAGALRIRLSDPDRLPVQLLAAQRAKERREASEAARRETNAAEAARIAKEREFADELREKLRETWNDYSLLNDSQRAEIDALVNVERETTARKVRERGGIFKLDQNSVAWRDFMEGVRLAMADLAEAEEFPDEDEEIEVDVDAIIERQVERFLTEMESGQREIGDVTRESWMAFDDDQWARVVDGVTTRLQERKAT